MKNKLAIMLKYGLIALTISLGLPFMIRAATQIDGTLEAGMYRVLGAGVTQWRIFGNSAGDMVFDPNAKSLSSPQFDVSGGFNLSSGTFNQLQAVTPKGPGYLYLLTNGGTQAFTLCLSTGTGLGAIAMATNTATSCK